MTPTLVAPAAARPTAADRCDRCGAAAVTRVLLTTGGELLFCGHHTRKFETTIRAVAAEVIGEDPVSEA